MGRIIVLQDVPHKIEGEDWEVGKFALWSSIVDDFIMYDCDENELIEDAAERAAEDARESIRRCLKAPGSAKVQIDIMKDLKDERETP